MVCALRDVGDRYRRECVSDPGAGRDAHVRRETIVIGGPQEPLSDLDRALSWVFNVREFKGETVICSIGGAYAYRSGSLEPLLDEPFTVKDIRNVGAETYLIHSNFYDS